MSQRICSCSAENLNPFSMNEKVESQVAAWMNADGGYLPGVLHENTRKYKSPGTASATQG